MKNVTIWGRFWVHHEADKNSIQLIPTHYEKHRIITSWAEWVEDEGYEMNNEWHKQAGSKFQAERQAKEDRIFNQQPTAVHFQVSINPNNKSN